MSHEKLSASIEVVCACDEDFLPHTATMLCSLLENMEGGVRIWHLHDGIDSRERRRMGEFVGGYDAEYSSRAVNNQALEGIKVGEHSAPANYFRLMIPDLLPESVERVIYLDSDILVRQSLNELWEISLDNAPVGAVRTWYTEFTPQMRLGLPYTQACFNSGVMLMDLSQWRDDEIAKKVLKYVRDNRKRIKAWDQDGLNAILAGQWYRLPPKWNVFYALPEMMKERYADTIADPAIIHFCGPKVKPWQKGNTYYEQYNLLRAKTPWGRRTGKSILKKIVQFVHSKVRALATKCRKNDAITSFVQEVCCSTIAQKNISEAQNTAISYEQESSWIEEKVPNMVVQQGPFSGVELPEHDPGSNCALAKLIGTYESELHEVMAEIIQNAPSSIITVNCDDGYYPVGFAKRMPTSEVFAYEEDGACRNRVSQMARVNGVAQRIHVKSAFWLDLLSKIDSSGEGLLMMKSGKDPSWVLNPRESGWGELCRGYDLLLEIHPSRDPGILQYLKQVFFSSYKIKVINRIPDGLRHQFFDFELISDERIEVRQQLMAERRKPDIQWVYLTRK